VGAEKNINPTVISQHSLTVEHLSAPLVHGTVLSTCTIKAQKLKSDNNLKAQKLFYACDCSHRSRPEKGLEKVLENTFCAFKGSAMALLRHN